MLHPPAAALEAGLDEIRRSPSDDGRLDLIVRRPAPDEREVIAQGELDSDVGLVGDTWRARPSTATADGSPHPEKQLTVMNSRTARLVAGGLERAPLAGDQLYVDFDISEANLPAGTRLVIGSAVVEITAQPHRGCKKFTERFGADSLRFVNSTVGNELRLRGANAKVVVAGTIRTGDAVRKV